MESALVQNLINLLLNLILGILRKLLRRTIVVKKGLQLGGALRTRVCALWAAAQAMADLAGLPPPGIGIFEFHQESVRGLGVGLLEAAGHDK